VKPATGTGAATLQPSLPRSHRHRLATDFSLATAVKTPTATASFDLPDADATAVLGARLATAIALQACAVERDGLVLTLSGDLGSGKTTLVRGLLRALGVQGPIKSPTFALLESYPLAAEAVSRLSLYHSDFYRFRDESEFSQTGFRELFGPAAICAIEWPERVGERLPTPDLAITLQVTGEGRRAAIAAFSPTGVACLTAMSSPTADAAATAGRVSSPRAVS
jgi:tRNA threonylcarbamoyladenosine biosynthesis protein TsaE